MHAGRRRLVSRWKTCGQRRSTNQDDRTCRKRARLTAPRQALELGANDSAFRSQGGAGGWNAATPTYPTLGIIGGIATAPRCSCAISAKALDGLENAKLAAWYNGKPAVDPKRETPTWRQHHRRCRCGEGVVAADRNGGPPRGLVIGSSPIARRPSGRRSPTCSITLALTVILVVLVIFMFPAEALGDGYSERRAAGVADRDLWRYGGHAALVSTIFR